ncbi:MAG: hypothetical protein ABF297_00150 [Thiogranum sp.]
MTTYFYFSVLILAILLFLPVSKMIWVISVRRLQRKSGRELSTAEIEAQKRRSRFIALFLLLPFSWFFNYGLLGLNHG